jgi:hypothetical protein
MALLQKNISLVGTSIALETIVTPAIPNEYYPVSAIRSVNATYSPSLQPVGGVYPYPSMLKVDIYFHDVNMQRVSFDIQSIANQAGWTADLTGLTQAIDDINGWITTANSITPIGLATEVTLQSIATNTTGVARTPGIIRPNNTSGNLNTVAATFYSVSLGNVGAANGTVLGATIKPGEILNFSADAVNNFFNSFVYDATGTEFIIIYVA